MEGCFNKFLVHKTHETYDCSWVMCETGFRAEKLEEQVELSESGRDGG